MKPMRTIIVGLALLGAAALSAGAEVKAQVQSDAYFKLGPLDLTIPFKTVRGVYLYDFKKNRNLVGAETPVISLWDKVEGTIGAVTSLDGAGAPFVGANVLFSNVVEQWISLPKDVNVGGFGGRDFRAGSWIYGLKASLKLWGDPPKE